MSRSYYHYCYLTTNNTNGMKYFGVRSSECHPDQDGKYLGTGTKITAAIKEFGKGNFSKEVLATFDSRDDAEAYEEDYLATYDYVDDPNYYNVSARSTGGRFDYHEDLKDGLTASPQEKNGAQKNFKPKPVSGESHIETGDYHPSSIDTSKVEVPGVNHDGTLDGRTNHKGQMGGKRPGAGRPKGSKSIYSKESVQKLQDLDHDPIEHLSRLRNQIMTDIDNTRSISARTAMYNTLMKIEQSMLPYGYRPVPREDKKVTEDVTKGPMAIVLTEPKKEEDSKDD